MYQHLDDYLIMFISEFSNVIDIVTFLKSNHHLYSILIENSKSFKEKYVNFNQLCVKCYKTIDDKNAVIHLCRNHNKFPTFHKKCYHQISIKKNYIVDKCIYCHENIFAIKTRNLNYFR